MIKVAIIPARGGSKRIPRKNIKLFHGIPIIAYTIEACIKSGVFDRIIVSTDDNEIADVASRFGAETPFVRPLDLSDDYTGTNAVTKHAIEWMGSNGIQVDYACCVYATAPFLRSSDIRRGLDLLKEHKGKFAFSVTSFPFPIQRALRIDGGRGVEAMFPDCIYSRSQDLEEAFHDAGQFYWGSARSFLDDDPLFSNASVPVILPRYLVQDIDTPEDWIRAENMYAAMRSLQSEYPDKG